MQLNKPAFVDLITGVTRKEKFVPISKDNYSPNFSPLLRQLFPDLPDEETALIRRLLELEGWVTLLAEERVKFPKIDTPVNVIYPALAAKHPQLKSLLKFKYKFGEELIVNYSKGLLPNLLYNFLVYIQVGIKLLRKTAVPPVTIKKNAIPKNNALALRIEPGVYAQKAFYPLFNGNTTVGAMLDKAAAIGLSPDDVEFSIRVRVGFLIPFKTPEGQQGFEFEELSTASLLRSEVTAEKAIKLAAFQMPPKTLVQTVLAVGYMPDTVLNAQKKIIDSVAKLAGIKR